VPGLDLSELRVARGDYTTASAEKALTGAYGTIVRRWFEEADGRKTLAFLPGVKSAALMAEAFQAAGVTAAAVSGSTPLAERKALLAAHRDGDLTVLANCAVLTEGYDDPSIECVLMARPTRSRALYTQMVGRGLRRHPGKPDCLVLDVVGGSDDHSLVTIPSLFGIEAATRRLADGETVAEVAKALEKELVAAGVIAARDAELFRKVRTGGIAWVPVEMGDTRRFIRPMGSTRQDGAVVELPTVVLVPRAGFQLAVSTPQSQGDDEWCCGLQWDDGTKRLLIDHVSLETAQGVGEDFIRKTVHRNDALVNTEAPWRRKRITPGQRKAAKRWGLAIEKGWTAGDLSEALDAHIARKKYEAAARRRGTPTRSNP
jgi:hypothetical protein